MKMSRRMVLAGVEPEVNRGTGRTSKQMRVAPQGALFVWCNSHLEYPRDLARHLGRTDLKIIAPSAARHAQLGSRRPMLYDHAYGFVS